MATLIEVQEELKKSKKECRELRKIVKEFEIREKFYQERLERAHEKNAEIRRQRDNMTMDDVARMQKARAEYVEKFVKDKDIAEAFDEQSKIKLDSKGINSEEKDNERKD